MGRAARKGPGSGTIRQAPAPSQKELLQIMEEVSLSIEESADISLQPTLLRERMKGALERRADRLREELLMMQSNIPERDWTAAEREYIYYRLMEIGVSAGHSPSEAGARDLGQEYPQLAGEIPPEKIPSVAYVLRYTDQLPDTPSGNLLRQRVARAIGDSDLESVLLEDYHEARILATLIAGIRIGVEANDLRIGPTEDVLHQEFEWAQERSRVGDQVSADQPLVMSAHADWLYSEGARGVSTGGLPGDSGAEIAVVFTQPLVDINAALRGQITSPQQGERMLIDENRLRKIMLHELIHDNQNLAGALPKGWTIEEYEALKEALTEGLAVLRMRSEGETLQRALLIHPLIIRPDGEKGRPEKIFPFASPISYPAEVSSLFRILEQAGIPDPAFEERIEYLNSLSGQEAIDTLQEWLGDDLRETFQSGVSSYQPEDRQIVARVFRNLET